MGDAMSLSNPPESASDPIAVAPATVSRVLPARVSLPLGVVALIVAMGLLVSAFLLGNLYTLKQLTSP
ncbi:MAG: hypothetical protein ABI743_12605, partial [bacterium]